jgi:hypothetical protein
VIIQPTFEISPDIEAGLTSGYLIRHGGVVRDSMGSIVKHLKEVPGPAKQPRDRGRVAASAKRPWGIITAAALSAIAVGVQRLVARLPGSSS